jgi:putative oxidoreductase
MPGTLPGEPSRQEFTMFRWYGYIAGTGSVGLLVLRIAVGVAFIIHGWPKIQNATTWMNGFGPQAPPAFLQAAAAVAEFGGGIGLIIGFLTPLWAFLLTCTMATAIGMVHVPHGDPFTAMNMPGQPYIPSWELAGIYLAASIAILLVGPGQLSLDCCLFGRNRSAGSLPPYATH